MHVPLLALFLSLCSVSFGIEEVPVEHRRHSGGAKDTTPVTFVDEDFPPPKVKNLAPQQQQQQPQQPHEDGRCRCVCPTLSTTMNSSTISMPR